MKKGSRPKRKNKERSLWQTVSIGIGGAVCCAFLLLLLCSRLALGSKDPSRWLLPCAILCGAVSAAFSGALSVRLDGRGNLVPAWLVGAGFSTILAILSFILPANSQNLWRWVFYAALVFCCFLGGVAARKRPKKRRHRG